MILSPTKVTNIFIFQLYIYLDIWFTLITILKLRSFTGCQQILRFNVLMKMGTCCYVTRLFLQDFDNYILIEWISFIIQRNWYSLYQNIILRMVPTGFTKRPWHKRLRTPVWGSTRVEAPPLGQLHQPVDKGGHRGWSVERTKQVNESMKSKGRRRRTRDDEKKNPCPFETWLHFLQMDF